MTDDTIVRKQAIDAVCKAGCGSGFCGVECDEVRALETLPPAQPQPEQKGYWRHYEGYLTCSECGTEYYADIMAYCGDDVPKFCPNCGADMRQNGGAV